MGFRYSKNLDEAQLFCIQMSVHVGVQREMEALRVRAADGASPQHLHSLPSKMLGGSHEMKDKTSRKHRRSTFTWPNHSVLLLDRQ